MTWTPDPPGAPLSDPAQREKKALDVSPVTREVLARLNDFNEPHTIRVAPLAIYSSHLFFLTLKFAT